MKLFDFAMLMDNPDVSVKLIDEDTRQTVFFGPAQNLLDFNGISYRRVTAIDASGGTIYAAIK